jgi:hypothetical protein
MQKLSIMIMKPTIEAPIKIQIIMESHQLQSLS